MLVDRSKAYKLFGFYYKKPPDEIVYISSLKEIFRYNDRYRIFTKTTQKWIDFEKEFKQKKFSLYAITDQNLIDRLRQEIKGSDRPGYHRSGLHIVKNPKIKRNPELFQFFRLKDKWVLVHNGVEKILNISESRKFENLYEVTRIIWNRIPNIKHEFKTYENYLLNQTINYGLLNG